MSYSKYRELSKEEFEQLRKGDDRIMETLYICYFPYVMGILINKYNCSKELAEDIFADSIMKYRAGVANDKIAYGNVKSYLNRIAINLFLQHEKRRKSELGQMKILVQQHKDGEALDQEQSLAKLLGEDEKEKMDLIKALEWAMEQIGDLCREILQDTIVKSIPPRNLVEKYNYKNARVVTDKKIRCKKRLADLIQEKLRLG